MEGKFGQSVEADSAKNVKFKYTVGREWFDLSQKLLRGMSPSNMIERSHVAVSAS